MSATSAATAVIVARQLCKNYGTRPAVVDVDLDVWAGEVFGFLGPNGAGKTTTIRMLLDLLRPSSGEVTVFGFPPQRGGADLRRRIGYLPGEFVVYDGASVLDTLRGLASLRGGVDERRIRSLAERFNLDLKRRVRELSKGNRQKLGLVQAFMHDPDLLILDEPTSGLDPLLRQEFVALIEQTRAAERTVFLSSHILSEVQDCAQRVAMIRDGRLVAVDTIAALRERAVRRVEIEFGDPVTVQEFSELSSLTDVSVTASEDVWILRGQLSGSADAAVKAAARHTVRTLQVEEPDLEEVFLALYEADEVDDGDV